MKYYQRTNKNFRSDLQKGCPVDVADRSRSSTDEREKHGRLYHIIFPTCFCPDER